MAFKNLTDWARKELKKSEIHEMIEELQALVEPRKDDDDTGAADLESPAQRRERALAGNPNPGIAGDSRGGLPRVTASAAKSFHGRYPEARAIRREG
jgi:hypothetical protein